MDHMDTWSTPGSMIQIQLTLLNIFSYSLCGQIRCIKIPYPHVSPQPIYPFLSRHLAPLQLQLQDY
jgi:hypothetical protein